MPIEVAEEASSTGGDQAENFDAVGTPEEEAAHSQSIEDWADEETEKIPEARPSDKGGLKGKEEKGGQERAEKGEKKGEEKAKPPYDPDARVKIKVDGEEVEITLDQAVREYRRRAAADKRFQEASAQRKAADDLMSKLKSDPWEALRELGVDPDKAASDRILAKIEEEKLAVDNPAELERRKIAKQLEQEKAAREALEKQKEEVELSKKRDIIRSRIDKQFTAALTEAKLPATPYTVARMAEVVARNIREDPRFDATPAELAQLVREDIQVELAAVLRSLKPEQIEAFLGEGTVKALRNHDLERVRNPKLQGQPRKLTPSEGRPRQKATSYTDPDVASKALEEWASEK